MAIHRGAYVRKLIEESELTITEIADRLSVGRNTLYRWMENDRLPLTKMLKLAEVLSVDITPDFPKAGKLKGHEKSSATETQQEEEISVKAKYLSLLEKHAQLLEEISVLKEEISRYKSK